MKYIKSFEGEVNKETVSYGDIIVCMHNSNLYLVLNSNLDIFMIGHWLGEPNFIFNRNENKIVRANPVFPYKKLSTYQLLKLCDSLDKFDYSIYLDIIKKKTGIDLRKHLEMLKSANKYNI